MKFALTATALLASALPQLATAWTFSDGYGHVWSGSNNKGCTTSSTKVGQKFKWDVGVFQDCCVHLYETASCTSEVGYSCDDWSKASSKVLKSFKITNC